MRMTEAYRLFYCGLGENTEFCNVIKSIKVERNDQSPKTEDL